MAVMGWLADVVELKSKCPARDRAISKLEACGLRVRFEHPDWAIAFEEGKTRHIYSEGDDAGRRFIEALIDTKYGRHPEVSPPVIQVNIDKAIGGTKAFGDAINRFYDRERERELWIASGLPFDPRTLAMLDTMRTMGEEGGSLVDAMSATRRFVTCSGRSPDAEKRLRERYGVEAKTEDDGVYLVVHGNGILVPWGDNFKTDFVLAMVDQFAGLSQSEAKKLLNV